MTVKRTYEIMCMWPIARFIIKVPIYALLCFPINIFFFPRHTVVEDFAMGGVLSAIEVICYFSTRKGLADIRLFFDLWTLSRRCK